MDRRSEDRKAEDRARETKRRQHLERLNVPDYHAALTACLSPKLKRIEGDMEATRVNSFEALNDCANMLRDDNNDPKIGLLEKRGGARVKDRASDIIAYDLGNGTCQLFDVIGDAEGEDGTPRASGWNPVAESEAGIRPIEQWRPPYGAKVPEEAKHRYMGGGNDTGTCDQCGRNKMDTVHFVAEGQVQGHTPWQGEDGKGDCDLCMKPVSDPIHRKAPEPGNGGGNVEARIVAVEARLVAVERILDTIAERLAAVESGASGGGLNEESVRRIVAALLKDIEVSVDVQKAGPKLNIFGQRINLEHDHSVDVSVKFAGVEVAHRTVKQLLPDRDIDVDDLKLRGK